MEKLGVKVTQANPAEDIDYQADLLVYTFAISADLLARLKTSNPKTEFIEAGDFTLQLLKLYDSKKLTAKEKDAFMDSDIAPLYKLDLGKIPVVGVTGTDGKTTTCEMLYHLLSKIGFKPAVVTTVSAKCGDLEVDTGFHTTTPTAQELFALLERFRNMDCTHIIVEITSHALVMGRVAGLKIDVAVVTNVKQDHLDYHKTWENYLEAKSFLVTKNLKPKGALIMQKTDVRVWKYLAYKTKVGQRVLAIPPLDIKLMGSKITFNAGGQPVVLNMLGTYNAYNACNALGACLGLGLEQYFPDLCRYLSDFKGVEGRMQVIQAKPFTVIVDFASTPNALESALTSAHETADSKGKVIVVFGCAGNRDSLKRPLMGAIAKKLADVTILTAEDPRTEKVSDINLQIKQGWDEEKGDGKKLISLDADAIENRRQAIRMGLELAEPGDVVIICGKGHEKSMCFGRTEYPWSDVKEVRSLLDRQSSDNYAVGVY